jgi:hypothetical protein
VLRCQVQSVAQARVAIAAGADAIVAQGSEAGDHGAQRATFTLVPEVADLLARESPNTLLLAAGGIADGRGLAAAVMLGADGVVMGTRFYATQEFLSHPNHKAAATGSDGTLRLHLLPYAPWRCRAEALQWLMTILRERLVKIGARIVRHGRSPIFQMAEVMVPRGLFTQILTAIATLRPTPPARC